MIRQERRNLDKRAIAPGFTPVPRKKRNVNKGLVSRVIKLGGVEHKVWFRRNKKGQPKRRNNGSLMQTVAGVV